MMVWRRKAFVRGTVMGAVFFSWVALCQTWAAGAEQDPHFFVIRLADVEVDGQRLGERESVQLGRQDYSVARVWLDGPGEAYLLGTQWRRKGINASDLVTVPHLAIRAPAGQDVRGRLFLVDRREEAELRPLEFRIPREQGSLTDKTSFYRTKRDYYASLLRQDIPGAAWFRHQIEEANAQTGDALDEAGDRQRAFFGRRRANDFENTFALVSGGRAVSENLQLDRVLPRSKPENALTEPLDKISGITVAEFDWSEYIQEEKVPLDDLALFVPADQHALFFSSFAAVLDMIDHADAQGTPVLRAAEPRAEDARTRERYQRQLCLPLGQVERLFGRELVRNVVVTGSDPYFRTGTDVAVLFGSGDYEALKKLIAARMALARTTTSGAAAVSGQIRGVSYQGVRSPDRTVCAYLASLTDVVIVTNSLTQLERILAVGQGETPALASLDEFRFFRQRYPLGDAAETALLIVSDPTIRRWCGPRWRIATSRRTRAAALMSEIQAQQLDALVAGRVSSERIPADYWVPGAEGFTVDAQGVRSDVYGSLEFQTPIAELDVALVSQEEKQFYERWRNGYQRYWSNFFDPIAIRFQATPEKLGVDMTVMPLIDRSDYRQMIGLSKGGQIDQASVDWHADALLHVGFALNPESSLLKSYTGMARSFAPQVRIDPLSWLGDGVAFYADRDPFWQEMAESEDAEEFLRDNFQRAPVALHVDVRSGFKLTAFLTGLRAFIEQSSPGMTLWETKTHNDRGYVKISPSAAARSNNDNLEEAAIYYAASGTAWVLSPNEAVIQRAIDRQVARQKAAGAADEQAELADPAATGEPAEADPSGEVAAGEVAAAEATAERLLGQNLNVYADATVVHFLATTWGRSYQTMMQRRAWGNLPVLNEWKQRYPERDPLDVHQQFWKTRLVCPGGGTYRWNEQWRTMESTVYGHPGEPRQGPPIPPTLLQFARGMFGLDFEEDGLRSRVELIRAAD